MKNKIKTVWSKRLKGKTSKSFQRIGSSINIDKRLYKQDIYASTIHTQMLMKQRIIPSDKGKKIIEGLKKIKSLIDSGKFIFEEKYEDIHLNIEKKLFQIIGPAAGFMHTARSRNDQVVTDFKLWVKESTQNIIKDISNTMKIIIKKAEKHSDTVMPGLTHLKNAQPISFAHYLLAYVEMLGRDRGRLSDCRKRLNELPLGSAALAGTSYPIDRHFVAQKLNFSKPTENSMDAVSDRDFAIEFMSVSSLVAIHLSRLAEELVIWSSDSFNFIKLPESYTTGSSIMPQKRNPDAAELIRAKPGRIFGNLLSLMTVLKGLPMTYGKDMQEDKEPVFDTAKTIESCIINMEGMIKSLEPIPDKMMEALQKGFPTATDLADYLVTELKIPFRDAHHLTGQIVMLAEKKESTLENLTIEEIKTIIPNAETTILDILKIESSVSKRTSYGGTAPDNVLQAIKKAKERFLKD